MSQKSRTVPGAGDVRRAARDPRGAEDPEDTSLKRPEGQTDLRAPHERDEAPDPLDDSETTPVGGPRQVIEQAASDVGRGLVDTDRRGIPSDVPAPGPRPEDSPGAETLQPEGIDRKSLSGRGEKRNVRPGKDATHT
jgi:hypothetical protein